MKKKSLKILAIDPGQKGAFVLLDGKKFLSWVMPLGEDKRVDFEKVLEIFSEAGDDVHVFLERAYGGQMGATAAFNYGRDFAALELAIKLCELPVTYIEATKWTKKIHEGISSDLKPKAKSIIAVKRLLPHLVKEIPVTPKSKAMHEGILDALLIAHYGVLVTK